MNQPDPRYEIESVAKALDLLRLFAMGNHELSIPDVCRQLGVSKATAFRLLHTLATRGFVEPVEGTNRYHLGLVLFHLGNIVHNRMELRTAARPFMQTLSEQTGESVVLVILAGHERVCIEKVEGANIIRPFVLVGVPLPLHAGASGLVLLAHQSEAFVDRVISDKGLPALTERTITDRGRLNECLAQIRKQGYAVSRGDRVPDGAAVSAPVRSAGGEVVAALTVSLPLARLTQDRTPSLVHIVQQAAQGLSANLGWSEPEESEDYGTAKTTAEYGR